jgi:hypothetical protein
MILNAILKDKIDNDFLHNENMIYIYIYMEDSSNARNNWVNSNLDLQKQAVQNNLSIFLIILTCIWTPFPQ